MPLPTNFWWLLQFVSCSWVLFDRCWSELAELVSFSNSCGRSTRYSNMLPDFFCLSSFFDVSISGTRQNVWHYNNTVKEHTITVRINVWCNKHSTGQKVVTYFGFLSVKNKPKSFKKCFHVGQIIKHEFN